MKPDAGTVAEVVAPVVNAAAPVAAQAAPQQASIVWFLVPMVALAIVFVVELARALPWSEKSKGEKPLGCDACMATWVALAVGIYFGVIQGAVWSLVHVLPGAGLAVLLLALRSYWKGSVFGAPPSA